MCHYRLWRINNNSSFPFCHLNTTIYGQARKAYCQKLFSGGLAHLPYSEGERKETRKVCACGGVVGEGKKTRVFHLMLVLFQPNVVRLIKVNLCVLIEEWYLSLYM